MEANFQIKNNKIDSLTGARFVAILLVVICHFEFLESYPYIGPIYKYLFHNATMGVDFFFMLSGFGMMLGSMRRNPDGTEKIHGIRTLFDYAKRHIKKLYKLYVVMLLIGIPFEIINSHLYYNQTISYEIKYCTIAFFTSLTLLQSLTGRLIMTHALNGVCWFLSCLFCIYLMSPLIMRFLKRKVKSINQALLGIVICITISVLLAVVFDYIQSKTIFDDLTYGSPFRRVFYVIPGMLIAQIYSFKTVPNKLILNRKNGNSLEYTLLFISILWYLLRFIFSLKIGYFIYIIDMAIVSCDLYALALRKGKISKLLEKDVMVYLGNISMYIFLTHYLIRLYVDFIMRYLNIYSIRNAIIEIIIICTSTMIISMSINKYKVQTNKKTSKI